MVCWLLWKFTLTLAWTPVHSLSSFHLSPLSDTVKIIFLQPANHSCRQMERNSGYGRNLDFIPKFATKLLPDLRSQLLGEEGESNEIQVNVNDTWVLLKTLPSQFLFWFPFLREQKVCPFLIPGEEKHKTKNHRDLLFYFPVLISSPTLLREGWTHPWMIRFRSEGSYSSSYEIIILCSPPPMGNGSKHHQPDFIIRMGQARTAGTSTELTSPYKARNSFKSKNSTERW